ncbi:hypothetical protein L596_012346 [Steinernema carpocapsae]|uniref:Uncharacterized protein n=1 Tax=Steinernema carpocapsae TaxID=34508 RepID=A0A4V6A4S3_STECR|nr:hypothetical protein L596_012346 [Steinernema carpocapsae]
MDSSFRGFKEDDGFEADWEQDPTESSSGLGMSSDLTASGSGNGLTREAQETERLRQNFIRMFGYSNTQARGYIHAAPPSPPAEKDNCSPERTVAWRLPLQGQQYELPSKSSSTDPSSTEPPSKPPVILGLRAKGVGGMLGFVWQPEAGRFEPPGDAERAILNGLRESSSHVVGRGGFQRSFGRTPGVWQHRIQRLEESNVPLGRQACNTPPPPLPANLGRRFSEASGEGERPPPPMYPPPRPIPAPRKAPGTWESLEAQAQAKKEESSEAPLPFLAAAAKADHPHGLQVRGAVFQPSFAPLADIHSRVEFELDCPLNRAIDDVRKSSGIFEALRRNGRADLIQVLVKMQL